MSVKKRLIPALIASALAFGATAVQATTFSGVYVFGDSLSDSGYFRPVLIAGGLTPAQAAAVGRFTTNPGPVWSELVASYYGGNPAPSNAGGGIYAQGGARISQPSASTPTGATQRPVTTQIDEFLASGRANSRALYAIWAGANDLLQAGAAGVPFATAIPGQVARLQGAGGKYIAVFGLPNLGLTPGAQAGGAAVVAAQTQAAVGFNITLFNAIAASGQKVMAVDTFSLLNEIAANPSAYGFVNITTPACTVALPTCSTSTLVAAGADQNYLFADAIHPTSGAHAIIADMLKAMIDGPNAFSTMAEVPLATRAAHVRSLDEGLRTGATAEVGKATAFASGDGGRFDISSGTQNVHSKSNTYAATAGLTVRTSESATLGIAIGQSKADATLGSLGKYKLNETTLSAFAGFQGESFYINGSASVSDLRYNDIERYVKLGPATRTNRASTKGSNASATLAGGFDMPLGKFTVGPFVSYTSQSVAVTGFTENGGQTPLSTDLRMEDQSRESQVSSLGVRASMALGSWTPFARFSVDRDSKGGERDVSATPVTIAQNISYVVPGFTSDKEWVTATLGVRGKLSPRMGVSLVYTNVHSRKDIKQDGFTANFAYMF